MEYYWWLVIAIAFFILEILTPGFVIMWFGVGALVASLLDLTGIHNLYVQVIVFAIVSILLVYSSRTIFKNFFIKNSPGNDIKTNVDALIGKIGIVYEDIDNHQSTGRIMVLSQDWLARTADDSLITKNEKVKVIKTDGIKLIVEKI
jgi:membrane protein implicated in regulation of membrane protease activity